jgi:hypothetical protein
LLRRDERCDVIAVHFAIAITIRLPPVPGNRVKHPNHMPARQADRHSLALIVRCT